MLLSLSFIATIGISASIVPVLDKSAPVLCGRLAADAEGTLDATNAATVDVRSVRLFTRIDDAVDDTPMLSSLSMMELKQTSLSTTDDDIILATDLLVVKDSTDLQQHAAIKRSTPIIMTSCRSSMEPYLAACRSDALPRTVE